MPADMSIPAAQASASIINMTTPVSALEVPEVVVVPSGKTGGDDTCSGEVSVQKAKSEIARLYLSVDVKVCSASEQFFVGTKAYYARLVEKIRTHFAMRDEVEASLFGVAKYESVLVHLKHIEEAGYEFPEGLMEQVVKLSD